MNHQTMKTLIFKYFILQHKACCKIKYLILRSIKKVIGYSHLYCYKIKIIIAYCETVHSGAYYIYIIYLMSLKTLQKLQ